MAMPILDEVFVMADGFALNFSNRSFADFFRQALRAKLAPQPPVYSGTLGRVPIMGFRFERRCDSSSPMQGAWTWAATI